MMNHGKHDGPQGRKVTGRVRVPPEHDLDWEYTGAEHRCSGCGFRFEDDPGDLDFCPECGLSVEADEV